MKKKYIYIYIWDYGGHQLRLKCAQVRHHSPAGTFARVPGRCLGTPVTPCKIRSFTSIQMVHTHTLSHTQRRLHTEAFTDKHFHTQRPDSWNRNLAAVFGDQTSFRAKGFAGPFANRNFTSVFGDRTSFRAKGLRSDPRKRNFTAVLGFLAIGLHFVRKGCARTRESAILPQFWAFWRSDFISCERVAPGPEKAQFYRSFGLFGDRTSFRAKGLRFAPSRWHCPAPSREK